MKPRPIIFFLALAAALGAAEAPTTTKASPAPPAPASSLASLPPSALATKMKQVRASLDEVFKVREQGSALPDLRLNPFRIPGVPADSTQAQAGGRGAAPAPETEVVRLGRLASSLSLAFLEKSGQQVISIGGGSFYSEGQSVRMTDPVNNAQVSLRIKKIAGKSVTFVLGNSEFTVTR